MRPGPRVVEVRAPSAAGLVEATSRRLQALRRDTPSGTVLVVYGGDRASLYTDSDDAGATSPQRRENAR